MILSVEQVTIGSRQKKLVQNVSLAIQKGEWFALVGQSGSGKSILSQAVGQMLAPGLNVEGNIFLNGQNVLELSKKEMRTVRGRKLSYIFQDYQGSFTPFRTISQYLDEYQKAHGIHSPQARMAGVGKALQSVGLSEELAGRYPFQLNGGQLQRVSIAMALLLAPDLVIADEITTALDSVSGNQILELLARRQQETGCAILFITHDWRHVRRYADRIAVMKEGEIIESGGKHRILDHPQHLYTKQLIKAAPVLDHRLPSGLQEEGKT
ncbi:ABC transporter ATP-binding protein [Domibacillus sp. 8LH]|uniref:ABC transporter ATP-binding protein n=1 Tax=Domibacillus sp. 8LH TaxID=3073900 RepID=UPI003178D344